MNFRYLCVVLAIIISCTALFYGCGNSSAEKEIFDNSSNEQTITKESDSEENKLYEYKTEELWCKRDSNNIFGEIYIPQGEPNHKFPTVIIAHGFTGTYDNNVRFAEIFAKSGIVAYLFDFCGGSNESKSDGKTTEMSILTEKSDMMSVFEQIAKLDYVDPNNIFLMGESQGGVVASLCASELSENIRGLTLLYPVYNIPAYCIPDIVDEESVPDEYTVWGMRLGKIYYTDCMSVDIYGEISKFKGSVIIYHGTDDQIVPFSYSEKAVEIYENAELKAYEGAGHGFEDKLQYSTAEDMVKFIKANLI